MEESILLSIAKFIGLTPCDNVFDPDLVILINSEFSVLNQLKVGTDEPFRITGPEETWGDFFGDKKYLEPVKELIALKVKMIFDPPSNSYVMQAYKERADELEWRLNMFEDVETPREVEAAYTEDSY